ncbi:hypothetical protein [Spirosoma sp.]|uniref:hypothetical protein n=1 Tax=Spirosoma sp. TaxID=1899569 RepID=UPI003B3A632E
MTQQSESRQLPFREGNSGWTKSALGYLLVALPVVVFGIFWKAYAINIPKWDDHALRGFLFFFDQETTLSGKIHQLFRQHNEHRIVYDRVITLLDYWLFGKLSYTHLMVVGNLSLIGLLLVFIAILRRASKPVLYAIPVAFLLFNLSHWENMFWGMAALQNFSVVLWIIAAFYFLSYSTKWGLALIAAVLATITSGNGLVVWPIGFLLILLQTDTYRNRQTSWQWLRPLLGWLLAGAVVVGLYFTGFEKPGDITYTRPGIYELLKGWFAFIGAAAEVVPIGSTLNAGIVLGGLLVLTTLSIFAWTLWMNRLVLIRIPQQLLNPKAPSEQAATISSPVLFFWSSALFILGTGAIVAWARTVFGIDLLMTSRYKPYSLTLLALLYTYAVVTFSERPGRWLMVSGTLGAIIFAGLSYLSFLDETVFWRHKLTSMQFNGSHSTNVPVVRIDSISSKYTTLASTFYHEALPILYGSASQPLAPIQIHNTATGFDIQNATMPAQGLGDSGNYLIVRSTKRLYLFPVHQNQRSALEASFQPSQLFTTGFRTDILSSELEAGTYQLYVLTVSNDNRSQLYPTNQTLTSTGPPTTSRPKNW